MEHGGFGGKILFVDLTTGIIKKEPLDPELARKFLGGFGIDHRLLYELLKPGTDPLSPENPIIIGVGPLVGTLALAAAKVTLTAKRPICASPDEDKYPIMVGTGGSVKFGFMLKNAGYDRVVITGRAERPVFLKIVNDEVEICDAADLWGKMDAYEATDELVRRYGRCGVYAIGKAGENLVRFAIGTVDGKTSLGKAGGGAIMGSKNLKAIVVYGNKGIQVSDSKRLKRLFDSTFKRVTENPGFKDTARYGAVSAGAMSFRPGNEWRSFWGKHWQLVDKTRIANRSCLTCLTPCQSYMEIKDGRFAGLELVRRGFPMSTPTRPVLEESMDYGPGLKVEDVIERLGLDRQYTQQVVDFVSRLYERGEISKEDTDGLVLRRRAFWDTDIDSTVKLIERIADREGDFARCLGEGWYPISKRFGVNPNEEMSICKGASTILDARKTKLGPAVFTNITGYGVHHIHFFGYFPGLPLADIKANCENMGLSREEIDRALTAEEFSIGRITKHIEDYYAILNSLGTCAIPPQINAIYDVKLLAWSYSAVTGFETSHQELRRLGEKAWNLYKLLNVREGFSRKEDMIPAWWKAIEDSHTGDAGAPKLLDYWGKPVTKDGLEKMLDDYYHERGWDAKSGIPTKAKLAELELEEFAEVVPK